MNTTKIKLTIVGICGVFLLPTAADASSATLINDNTALFTIDFTFADELFDVQVPIAAEVGVTYLDRVDTLGYTLESASANGPAVTELNALVLSTQPIEDNRYAVTAGKKANFTLVILATFAETVETNYRATVTKLPYWLNDRRTTVHQNQLDEITQPILEIAE